MTPQACPALSPNAIFVTVVNGLIIGICMNAGFFVAFGTFAKIMQKIKEYRENKTYNDVQKQDIAGRVRDHSRRG